MNRFLSCHEEEQAPTDAGGYGFDKFGSITPDHPLANRVLVDVEISPPSSALQAEGNA
ncbi:MAG: hypothetical protein R3F37_03060 [Candidatus Competibacteraceae bacterium]